MREGKDRLKRLTCLVSQGAANENGKGLFVGDVSLGDLALRLVGGKLHELVVPVKELGDHRFKRAQELLPGHTGHGVGYSGCGFHRCSSIATVELPLFEDRIRK